MLTTSEKIYFYHYFKHIENIQIYIQIRNYLIYKWEKSPKKRLNHTIYFKTFLHQYDKNLVLRTIKYLENCCLINYGFLEDEEDDECQILDDTTYLNESLKNSNIDLNIVIIGAGLSGLIAAHTLKEHRFENVVLLEARDRTGGRICTYHHRNFWVDLGCDHIIYNPENNQEPNPLLVLCKQIGLQIIDIDPFCPLFEGRVTKIPKAKCEIMETELIDMLNTLCEYSELDKPELLTSKELPILNTQIALGDCLEILIAAKEKFAKEQQMVYLKEKLSYQNQLLNCILQLQIIENKLKVSCNFNGDVKKLLNSTSVLHPFSNVLANTTRKSLIVQLEEKYKEQSLLRQVLEERLTHMKNNPPCDFYFSFRDRNLLDWHIANMEYQHCAPLSKLHLQFGLLKPNLSENMTLIKSYVNSDTQVFSSHEIEANKYNDPEQNYEETQDIAKHIPQHHFQESRDPYHDPKMTPPHPPYNTINQPKSFVSIESGFASLPFVLAKDLNVKYGMAVRKINYGAKKISIECSDTADIIRRHTNYITERLKPATKTTESTNASHTIDCTNKNLPDETFIDNLNNEGISIRSDIKIDSPKHESIKLETAIEELNVTEESPYSTVYEADIVICTLPLGVLKASLNDYIQENHLNSNESHMEKIFENYVSLTGPGSLRQNNHHTSYKKIISASHRENHCFKRGNAPLSPNKEPTLPIKAAITEEFNEKLTPLFIKSNPNIVKFNPPLPEPKIKAIQNLGVGLTNKVILHFDKRFWDDYQMFGYVGHSTPESRGEFFLFKCYDKTTPTLTAIISGHSAIILETLTDVLLVERCLTILKRIFGNDNVSMPKESIVTRWGADIWSKGCSTFIPPGASVQDIGLLAEPLKASPQSLISSIKNNEEENFDNSADSIFTPFQNLLFAGEHTSISHYGTARGALLTGLREASRIIQMCTK